MSSDHEKKQSHRMVKWSPPYRRENVEPPEFDLLALSSFRENGLYASRSKGEGGDEFLARSQRDGLKAALQWREQTFGNRYRGEGQSTEEEESD